MRKDLMVALLGVTGAATAVLGTTVAQVSLGLVPILLAVVLIAIRWPRRKGTPPGCSILRQGEGFVVVGTGGSLMSSKLHLTRGGAETEARDLGLL